MNLISKAKSNLVVAIAISAMVIGNMTSVFAGPPIGQLIANAAKELALAGGNSAAEFSSKLIGELTARGLSQTAAKELQVAITNRSGTAIQKIIADNKFETTAMLALSEASQGFSLSKDITNNISSISQKVNSGFTSTATMEVNVAKDAKISTNAAAIKNWKLVVEAQREAALPELKGIAKSVRLIETNAGKKFFNAEECVKIALDVEALKNLKVLYQAQEKLALKASQKYGIGTVKAGEYFSNCSATIAYQGVSNTLGYSLETETPAVVKKFTTSVADNGCPFFPSYTGGSPFAGGPMGPTAQSTCL